MIRQNTHYHHQACPCREHKLAVLNKAALGAACLLDWLKNLPSVADDDREQAALIVERIYRASEALGGEIGSDEELRIERMDTTQAAGLPAYINKTQLETA